MDRQRWRDLLGGIGLIAIVASLVFLGIETRNSTNQTVLNTQALEIAAYQELMNNISEINALSVESRNSAEIAAKIYDQSADVDGWQTNSALFMLFRHGDMAYFMFERGVIDEDRLLSALRPLPLQSQLGQNFWDSRKFVFVKPYQNYVDRQIKEGFWEDWPPSFPLVVDEILSETVLYE